MKFCAIDGCDRASFTHGFCRSHFDRLRRRGTIEPFWKSPIERILARVEYRPGPLATQCWVCTKAASGGGYTAIRTGGPQVQTHRISYEYFRGPIPEGLVIDHLCRNRRCVNPDHLEPVTQRENVLRGESPSAILHRLNICKRGHSLEDAIFNGRTRSCRTCMAEYQRQYRRNQRAS